MHSGITIELFKSCTLPTSMESAVEGDYFTIDSRRKDWYGNWWQWREPWTWQMAGSIYSFLADEAFRRRYPGPYCQSTVSYILLL